MKCITIGCERESKAPRCPPCLEVAHEMANAIITSLIGLRVLIDRDPIVRAQWAQDPARCLRIVIETLEKRHIQGQYKIKGCTG